MLSFKRQNVMIAKHLKTMLVYGAILGGGLGIGYGLPHIVKMMKPAYTEGDYSAYYPNPATKVMLYGTATCPHCIKARNYLREQKIAFADIDVSSGDGLRDFAKLGGSAVPVILIGNRQIIGFDKSAVEQALEKFVRAPGS